MHILSWFRCSLTLLLLLLIASRTVYSQAAHCPRHNRQCGPESQSLVTSYTNWKYVAFGFHADAKNYYHSQFASHHTAVIMFTKRSLDAAMTNHIKCVHSWQLFCGHLCCHYKYRLVYRSHWHAHTILMMATESGHLLYHYIKPSNILHCLWQDASHKTARFTSGYVG
jgi:hypothetical protein